MHLYGRLSLLVVTLSLLGSPSHAFGQKPRRDVLTAAEIQESAARSGNLHAAIRSLRPHFLAQARGVRTLGNSITEPLAVFVNGARQTDVDALKTIQAAAVEEVRFLGPNEAGNQFGPKANGGALMVRLRKASGASPAPPPPPPPAAG